MKHDLAVIQQFITEHFNDPELKDFCFAYFRDVFDNFTDGMGKRQKVLELVDHCRRHGRIADLMASLRRERGALYDQYFGAQSLVQVSLPSPRQAPPQRNPRQIFVSHAHEDAEFAQRLASDLEAEGWPVWLAPDSIQPGEKWVEAINRGLEESGIFVLLLTPAAVESRWVRDETNVAIELMNEGEIRFIPLQVQPCKLPAIWRAYQRIPFRAGYNAGLNALLAKLEPERVVRPQRRVVTVLFADVSGFTTLLEQIDPEELFQNLNAHLTLLVQSVNEHQGLVEIIAGDTVRGLYNTPLNPQTDHVKRAVQTALAIQKKMLDFQVNMQKPFAPLSYGIGIHTGEVVLGDISGYFSVMGDALNLAKRLQEFSSPGQIVISRAVFEQVKEWVRAEEIPPIQVKGKAQPEMVYILLGAQ
jgi:class 3 adenylate cyclase